MALWPGRTRHFPGLVDPPVATNRRFHMFVSSGSAVVVTVGTEQITTECHAFFATFLRPDTQALEQSASALFRFLHENAEQNVSNQGGECEKHTQYDGRGTKYPDLLLKAAGKHAADTQNNWLAFTAIKVFLDAVKQVFCAHVVFPVNFLIHLYCNDAGFVPNVPEAMFRQVQFSYQKSLFRLNEYR